MEQFSPTIRGRMRTPRAAAIAGILFSVLLATTLVLLRVSVTAVSDEAQGVPATSSDAVELALNLVPFAGIAFLWFIGVVRDRFGAYEDRFFATVFLGSGILFLAMFFVSAAMAGAIVIALNTAPNPMIESGVYLFGRAIIARIMNVYALKMAGVFMISTATIAIRTGILPRWIAFHGYGLALLLLLSSHFFDWLGLVFPLWVFIMSMFILLENLRTPTVGKTTNEIGGNI
ncbi:MAG TPA: hypothetical protein DCZ69_11740 [Syntrophobacteraceae bacterium]|nr:hypothetical protein [Syntrophobacteraceae bacterium]